MEDSKLQKYLNRWGVESISFIMLVIVAYYLLCFGSLVHGDQEKFGQFGDYLGGVLNPILSFSAFLILIYTYRDQRKENDKRSKKDEESQENSRFFEMLSILNQLAISVEVDVETCEPPGGNSRVHMKSIKTYRGHRGIGRAWNILRDACTPDPNGITKNASDLISSYTKWEEAYWASVESYYDSAIFIIDEYICKESCADCIFYAAALKSQMSSNEKNILFLITSKDKKIGSRFLKLEEMGFWKNCSPTAIEIKNAISKGS